MFSNSKTIEESSNGIKYCECCFSPPQSLSDLTKVFNMLGWP